MFSSRKIALSFFTLILISFGFMSTGAVIEKSHSSETQNPILFLHGWTKTNSDWDLMKLWFKIDGWPVSMLFAYTFDDIIDSCSGQAHINYSLQIKNWVDDILDQTEASKIDLVGHSSGGLAIRHYVKFINGTDKVDDVVIMASCNHGTTHTAAAPCFAIPDNLSTFLITLNEGDETPGGILNDTIGHRVDTVLNVTYNGTHIPGNINYTSIYSADDIYMVPRNSSILEGAYNIEISGVDHSMYAIESVYKLVKAAISEPVTSDSTTVSTEVSGTTSSVSTESTTATTVSTSTTPLIDLREILLFMGLLVMLKYINHKKNEL